MILRFKSYLAGSPYKMNEDSIEAWAHQVAVILPSVLRKWYDSDFTAVESKDASYFEKARKTLAGNGGFKQHCDEKETTLQALKLLTAYYENETRKAGLGKTTKKPMVAGAGAHAGRVTLPALELTEGEIVEVHFAKHERNAALRVACIEHYRLQHGGDVVCEACGLDFGKRYGKVGEGYIEVHHLSPISQTEGTHSVDPKTDLVPLCANCHAMIHRVMGVEKKATGAALEGEAALERLRSLMEGYA